MAEKKRKGSVKVATTIYIYKIGTKYHKSYDFNSNGALREAPGY